MARLPKVILLHSRDCGRAIAPYGWPVHTPHLLGLAREGVLFRNAFSPAPTCALSRAAMLTGEYPHHSRIRIHRGAPFLLKSEFCVTKPWRESWATRKQR
ncbi:MAG: hypothetical protein EBY32_20130 [Proteobacteria bacterium]|nr:hypothetical protein [Pseudomonadota bacterium]